jgi:uncharacterized protein (DUF302 family)
VAEGIITKPSHRSVDDAVARLRDLLDNKGLTLFALVDHSGEAERVGQHLPNTKLVVFGSPRAGTALMVASPLSALDLPLKLLIWEDESGSTFISYNSPTYVGSRHHLSDELTARLEGVESLSEALTGE